MHGRPRRQTRLDSEIGDGLPTQIGGGRCERDAQGRRRRPKRGRISQQLPQDLFKPCAGSLFSQDFIQIDLAGAQGDFALCARAKEKFDRAAGGYGRCVRAEPQLHWLKREPVSVKARHADGAPGECARARQDDWALEAEAAAQHEGAIRIDPGQSRSFVADDLQPETIALPSAGAEAKADPLALMREGARAAERPGERNRLSLQIEPGDRQGLAGRIDQRQGSAPDVDSLHLDVAHGAHERDGGQGACAIEDNPRLRLFHGRVQKAQVAM